MERLVGFLNSKTHGVLFIITFFGNFLQLNAKLSDSPFMQNSL